MREILFRGKPLENPKLSFIYGSLLIFNDCYSIEEHKPFAFAKPINSETLGQFTGIYDRNGVRIFEGDIIKTAIGNVIVIFKACGFMGEVIGKQFYYDLYDDNLEFVEVIGNIYDNPELLSGE